MALYLIEAPRSLWCFEKMTIFMIIYSIGRVLFLDTPILIFHDENRMQQKLLFLLSICMLTNWMCRNLHHTTQNPPKRSKAERPSPTRSSSLQYRNDGHRSSHLRPPPWFCSTIRSWNSDCSWRVPFPQCSEQPLVPEDESNTSRSSFRNQIRGALALKWASDPWTVAMVQWFHGEEITFMSSGNGEIRQF